jgi:predicted deacylase
MSNHNSRLSLAVDLSQPGRQIGDLMLRWSDNTNPLGYHPIPVISLKRGGGPVVLVVGGTPGDEFEGPAAIMRLINLLDPSMLNGQIIAMPGLNAPAFQSSERVSPLDGVNLNRAFPGDPDGGPTAMLAHFVETEILPLCDAVIDLHSGGKASVFATCALATRAKDTALRAKNYALARAFGLPIFWVLGANNDNRSLNAAAERAGVPMMAAELGGGGGVDPYITDQAEEGLLRCLEHLGVIAHEAPPSDTPKFVEIGSPLQSLYATSDGLFDRMICAGQTVQSGDLAGSFHFPMDPSRPSMTLKFSEPGFILAHCARGLVRRGELLALVVNTIFEET